jgi:hypothetical protein
MSCHHRNYCSPPRPLTRCCFASKPSLSFRSRLFVRQRAAQAACCGCTYTSCPFETARRTSACSQRIHACTSGLSLQRLALAALAASPRQQYTCSHRVKCAFVCQWRHAAAPLVVLDWPAQPVGRDVAECTSSVPPHSASNISVYRSVQWYCRRPGVASALNGSTPMTCARILEPVAQHVMRNAARSELNTRQQRLSLPRVSS